MDESGVQENNKPASVITGKGSKSARVLTSGEKGENVTVKACCNAAGSISPSCSNIQRCQQTTRVW
jgi:hypothetical protein